MNYLISMLFFHAYLLQSQAKIFLNGKVVHEANVVRPAFQGEVIDVSLKEGWNKLQIKVTNGDGGWEAWAKLQNAAGGRLEGQRVKAE